VVTQTRLSHQREIIDNGRKCHLSQSIFIDNNVWDFLYKRNLDLYVELPAPDFSIGLTREAEFEIPPIANPGVLAFAEEQIIKCNIVVDTFFGFHDPTLPDNEQRVGGFGSTRWISREESEFIAAQNQKLSHRVRRMNEKTRLHKEEADVAIASRSFHSIVLTLDSKEGPLLDALRQGGKVVFLTHFDSSKKTLRKFIADELTAARMQPSPSSPHTAR